MNGERERTGHHGEPHLSTRLEENLEELRRRMHRSGDIVVKSLLLGSASIACAIVSLEGLADSATIQRYVVFPILEWGDSLAATDDVEAAELLERLSDRKLAIPVLERDGRWEMILSALLAGQSVILLDGADRALIVKTAHWPSRSIEEPQTEALIRGPREGFNENITTNLALIRKQLRDPNLVVEPYSVGRRSRQPLYLIYIKDIIHPRIVEEARRRLHSIDIDRAQEAGIIEQWIEDSFLSPFPQIQNTERPDKVSAALLQGKAAILLDGTPFALIAPTTFVSLVQSPEDYYERWMIGTLIRFLRYIALCISMLLPALYVALISFHPGMIPFKLAFSIAASREGVPFPGVIEALLMEGTLELLREAGIRLPKPIGQTIGIVGGLVIGEAAVEAGVVSPIMVIVVAITAIASFSIPSYSAGISFRMLRFATMLAAGIFGLFGIVLAFIMICVHLARLYSFGIPYLAPLAPSFRGDWKDLLIRMPVTMLTKRPQFMATRNAERADKEDRR